MIQMAGPNLTPTNLEQGAVQGRGAGGTTEILDPFLNLGDRRRTTTPRYDDMREIYFTRNKTSPFNGAAGTYVDLNNGRRFTPGPVPEGSDRAAAQGHPLMAPQVLTQTGDALRNTWAPADAPSRRPWCGPVPTESGRRGRCRLCSCRHTDLGVRRAELDRATTGSSLGALYGLIGAGVILIYRTNRIINFAAAAARRRPCHGRRAPRRQQGLVAGTSPSRSRCSAASSSAALIDVVVIRRFATRAASHPHRGHDRRQPAPRLHRHLHPRLDRAADKIGFTSAIDTPFSTQLPSRSATDRSPATTSSAFVMVVGVVAGAGGRSSASPASASRCGPRPRTPTGRRCSGIPVRHVGTVAWAIAGLFAARTIFLRASLVGVPVDGTLGPTVLLYALAAAVIARMESIPIVPGRRNRHRHARPGLGLQDGQQHVAGAHHARRHPRGPAGPAHRSSAGPRTAACRARGRR